MRFLKLLSILFFIPLITFSQTTHTMPYYETGWKKADSAMKAGLNATAEKEILVLLTTAKKENNTEQIIKAICGYRVSMRDRDETARLHDIGFFESQLTEAKTPVKQILHSMLGDLYWTYYQENRWKILDRTQRQITTSKGSDAKNDTVSLDKIETWSADQFYEKAYDHFYHSLEAATSTQEIKMTAFNELAGKEKNTANLRPTLFDFLVHRAIAYFGQEENELTKAAYTFEIKSEMGFASASVFMKANFQTADTMSQKLQVLKLYQQVLSFHSADQNPAALIDADIARLQYINRHSILPNKNQFYLNSLDALIEKYANHEGVAMAMFYKAESYTHGARLTGRKGYSNNTMNEEKVNYVEAKKGCELILQKFPDSEGGYRASLLLQQIESHSLSMNTEKVVTPQQASLALVYYKNVKTAYCKVIKLSVKEYKEMSLDYNDQYEKVSDKKAFKQWFVNLPERNDYKGHSTEIKIEPLPVGAYALIISESSTFEKGNHTSLSFLNVSDLSYITSSENNGKGTDLYVIHRETGEPQKDVAIKTWINFYDYETRKYTSKEGPSYTTDLNGMVRLRTQQNQSGYNLELIKGNDDLYLNDQVYINEYEQHLSDQQHTFFFTDRSIYRPGQTIYFKGIMVLSKRADNKQHELMKDRTTTVRLRDVNYQIVKEMDVTTNAFGSFSGTFQAPEGLLTGQFQIEGENGSAFFNVEEYKRPKFEVVFDTLKTTYRLSDIIKVKGVARAYAGNVIDGASVKYRVERKARFPYYWCYYRWGQPASASMEIANGVAVTKTDGSFELSFNAIPDESIDQKTLPVFDYHVSADVTDINGETRSASSDISVSYVAMLLQMDVPAQADISNFKSLKVLTTNLAGVVIPTQVTLTCKKLKSPTRTVRSRLWGKAEINSFTEAEFRKDFPFDEYDHENDHMQWKEEKTVWTKSIQTTKEGLQSVQKTGKEEGWYVIEAKTKDDYGEEVTEKKYIRLSDYSKPQALPNEHLLMTPVKIIAEPNQVAKLAFSSPYENVHLLYQVNKGNSKKQWLSLNQNQLFAYPITEADRGGFYVDVLYVMHNRLYRSQPFIQIPWRNKELNISLETFRDKILPGSEQEWKLKISGTKKEKVSAELLATMYDASLDAFMPHTFNALNLFTTNTSRVTTWNSLSSFSVEAGRQISYRIPKPIPAYEKVYYKLNWSGLLPDYDYGMSDDAGYLFKSMRGGMSPMAANADEAKSVKGLMAKESIAASREEDETQAKESDQPIGETSIPLRSNFSETAFFFPALQTDKEGNVVLKFKTPDALTRWKLMAFAHTQNLRSGMTSASTLAQKELMIVPNTPRFFREGDKMIYSAKVSNLTDQYLAGEATLHLTDALTNEPLNKMFGNLSNKIVFAADPGGSSPVNWSIEIPKGFTNPVIVKVMATAHRNSYQQEKELFSDGEQNVVPVLLNSMLVTETMPFALRTNTVKQYTFTKLLNAGHSSTLRHYNLTLEYTGNPAWYAIQSLPYLTDFPYECAEQTFNRYYANTLASHIINSSPRIKEIFSTWKEKDSTALLSSLQKNKELKSALLQETPWVLEAKNEEEQKRNLAALFDLNRMSKELERSIRELELMQTPNGGYAWFKGMPDDRFMTQYIITGFGRLMHLGINGLGNDHRVSGMMEKAIPYLDARIKEDYEDLIKNKIDLQKYRPGYEQIQYLYMRSFFMSMAVTSEASSAFTYFKKQATTYWVESNRYMQGMLALALQRYGDKKTPGNIVKSLRENAIHNEEMGMYWKENAGGYWWYEAPVETQSLLIEVFNEVAMNEDEVDEMKVWLIKNKQTQHWTTTKATADACYALLLNGSYWLSSNPLVTISLGDKKINSSTQEKEAGTGYFKTSFAGKEIDPSMGHISVSVHSPAGTPGSGVHATTWGGVYWQYFEDLDKITSAETPLKLMKQLFIERNGDKGPVLVPISANETLKVGDKVQVRIELRVDRAMEYVHMKDMRGACFEPVNVLSHYTYQGGLGYYESTKDASTDFFFNWLQKGTYVFEYPLFVTNKGDYSNGVATIQCMYAPEFSSHSEGIRLSVK